MSFDEHRIKVLSFQPTFVAVTGRNRNVGMRPSDGITPTTEYFSFDDIEFINANSPVFRSGMLEIDEGARGEVYKRLNIDPENCIYEKDIDDMLLHPTMEGMKRIVAISDALTMERIRGHMIQHYSVLTQNVIKVIEQRHKELANGKRRSAIQIDPVVAEKTEANKEVDELNKRVAALTDLVAQLLAAKGDAVVAEPIDENKPEEKANETEAKPKRTGRPAKK